MLAREHDLMGRVVLITGGAGGIGRALGSAFAARGARIALLDRDVDGLDAAQAELAAQGADVSVHGCDVTRVEECEAAIASVTRRFGGIDVLVNNAGLVHRSGFAETDVEVLRRVMDVNYFGAIHCTKAALSQLRKRRGAIVVVSSIAGVAPLFGRSGYAGSKHALHGLFESLRAELAGEGVSVTMVCPSFTASGFEGRALGPHGERVTRPRSKVGRVASPNAVARAIVQATAERRRLLVLSPVGKLSYLLSRLAPATYERLMRRSLRGELSGTLC